MNFLLHSTSCSQFPFPLFLPFSFNHPKSTHRVYTPSPCNFCAEKNGQTISQQPTITKQREKEKAKTLILMQARAFKQVPKRIPRSDKNIHFDSWESHKNTKLTATSYTKRTWCRYSANCQKRNVNSNPATKPLA